MPSALLTLTHNYILKMMYLIVAIVKCYIIFIYLLVIIKLLLLFDNDVVLGGGVLGEGGIYF